MSLDEVSLLLGGIKADVKEIKERIARLEAQQAARAGEIEQRVRVLEKALIGLSAIGGFLVLFWHFVLGLWK
jgi:hypothetical protein